MLLNMFQDVSVAPVAKDDSFTLVQEGLAHFLKNKYYHHGIRGEKFRERASRRSRARFLSGCAAGGVGVTVDLLCGVDTAQGWTCAVAKGSEKG